MAKKTVDPILKLEILNEKWFMPNVRSEVRLGILEFGRLHPSWTFAQVEETFFKETLQKNLNESVNCRLAQQKEKEELDELIEEELQKNLKEERKRTEKVEEEVRFLEEEE
jgi:hypothetical protein